MNSHTKNRLIVLALICLSLIGSSFTISNAQEQDTVCILYFYGNGCSVCAETTPFIDQLEVTYSLKVHRFEVTGNITNAELLTEFFDQYGIPPGSRGIPVVVIGDRLLLGKNQIDDSLENLIQAQTGSSICPIPQDPSEPPSYPDLVSFILIITGAGLIDSVNPCALAILIFLLNTLIGAGDKRRALKSGLAFSASLYIAYFLFGLGLFSAIQFSGFSLFFYWLMGLLTIFLGILNIKEYFWYGRGIKVGVPQSWQPTIQRLIEQATSPKGAFLLGFVITLVELPCTGGPYLLILALLADRTIHLYAIPFLLYYNILFILPMLILTIGIYLGFSTGEGAKEWRDRNKRRIHLLIGIVLVALGLVVSLRLL